MDSLDDSTPDFSMYVDFDNGVEPDLFDHGLLNYIVDFQTFSLDSSLDDSVTDLTNLNHEQFESAQSFNPENYSCHSLYPFIPTFDSPEVREFDISNFLGTIPRSDTVENGPVCLDIADLASSDENDSASVEFECSEERTFSLYVHGSVSVELTCPRQMRLISDEDPDEVPFPIVVDENVGVFVNLDDLSDDDEDYEVIYLPNEPVEENLVILLALADLEDDYYWYSSVVVGEESEVNLG